MLPNVVYIVDDDNEVLDSLTFFLKSAGYEPKPFSSGPLFLNQVNNQSDGCLLLDVRMADMDGFQVIEKLTASASRLSIVVMTGHGDIVTAVRAMKMGACDFMQKPFEESVLVEILQRQFLLLADQSQVKKRREWAQQRLRTLSTRENEVLCGLATGVPNKVVAYELGLSTRTVEMHRANMLSRLRVRTLPEALKLVFESGIDLQSSPSTLSLASGLTA